MKLATFSKVWMTSPVGLLHCAEWSMTRGTAPGRSALSRRHSATPSRRAWRKTKSESWGTCTPVRSASHCAAAARRPAALAARASPGLRLARSEEGLAGAGAACASRCGGSRQGDCGSAAGAACGENSNEGEAAGSGGGTSCCRRG